MPVEKIIRLVLLMLSLWGYVQFFSSKIKAEFAVGFTFSLIGSVMFFAGMADIMPFAVKLIIACGILCLAICAIKRISIKNVITPGTVFFAVMMCVVLYTVYGAVFVEQDNFTHWAYIAKLIIRNDRFPIASDPNVLFSAYPLGSASFIYFFCEALTADSEWFQMLCQAALMVSMLCPLFAFAKDMRGHITALAAAVFMLICYVGFYELLVDNLLAVAGFGGIAFCIYYKDDIHKKIWYTVPYMILLMAIKNSGLLFAVYMIVYILIVMDKKAVNFVNFILCSATPFVSLMLWQNHVKATFENGLTSKHSMSLENFRNIFGDKTAEDIHTIYTEFLKTVFSFSNDFIYTLIFVAVLLVLYKFVFKQKTGFFAGIAVFILVSYVVYQIGQFAMFMFTMPTNEAVVLACYERYHRTILVYVGGLLGIGVCRLKLPQRYSGNAVKVGLAVICAVVMWLTLTPRMDYFGRQHISPDHHRAVLNNLIAENNLVEDAGYVIVIDNSYFPVDPLNYTAKYLLGESAKTRTLQRVQNDPSIFEKYPYVIIYSETDEVIEYMESLYGKNLPKVIHTPTYQPVW